MMVKNLQKHVKTKVLLHVKMVLVQLQQMIVLVAKTVPVTSLTWPMHMAMAGTATF